MLVTILLTILSFKGNVKGQTDVTSMKLPAVSQGASVVYDVIHAGNYFFALSYDKLLVFDENGDYTTKFSLGGDFGKFNPISDGSQDYNYLCYNNNAGVVYAMQPDLSVLAVKVDLSEYWSIDPIINQAGATLNDSLFMMNGRMVMRMDNNHNRLYMLVSAMDVNKNPPGEFHSFKHCLLIYDIDITGTWTLFYDEYLGTESNYEDQINNVIFNEHPDKNFYYISRLGSPSGIIEVWEVLTSTVVQRKTLKLHNPDYPGGGATVRYQFGKMLSIYEPPMNKILVFPRKYRATKSEQFFARICVIDGDHDSNPANIEYDSIDSPSKKIHDAIFLTENNDLILSFPQSEELSQDEDLNDKDIAVYHFDGTDFIPAANFGYATENNTLQLEIFDDNASLKLHQINDGTALISKKDGLIEFEFMDTDYSASPVINAESNFYGNGAKGTTYSCMINNAACQLDFVKNSNGELYDEKTTSLAYPAYYTTANADGSKLYFYNTLHAHNTGLYIWKDDGGGLVNINNDNEESNNITSAIGDCVYNPFTGHFLISENTQYDNAPARVIVINDNENNEFVQNIELTHNNEDADFAGEMFVAPNEKLYVMANMRCADPKPKIFVFDANDYDYLSTIQLSSLVYDDSTAFFTGYFSYNPHDQGVYATLVPMFYSPDPYHTVKNSMYMNLGYEDYTGKGYIIRLSDDSYTQLDFPGKMIIPDRGNWGNESQYDDYLFTIGKKFYFLDYTNPTLTVEHRNEIFNDITYSPVHDRLFALRDEEDSDREDRKIQIYAINMLENGSPVFEKLDHLVYAGQAAGIFYNPIDNFVYVYQKFDDTKLGDVPVKLLYFDPSEENPHFDSIPLGFTSYYPELDHCRDYYKFFFYNIIEPYFNINNNRAFFPNGGFSTVSMIQFEPRDVLNLRSGITWLSFPRIEDRDPDGYVPAIPVLENNISTPAYTDLLLENLPPQDNEIVELTWDQYNSWDDEFLSEIKSTLGYKLTLEPGSVRYLSMYGTTPVPGSSDADVELYNGYENWVGYYLPETQSIFDAIPEDVLDDIIEIKHQDWFVYNEDLPDPRPRMVPAGQDGNAEAMLNTTFVMVRWS
ncbi:MAG: hypothetical protein U5Q03_09375 [Bacteroidota bacterium]|nr:hypothetical protein [Bacteroidota bacterium]